MNKDENLKNVIKNRALNAHLGERDEHFWRLCLVTSKTINSSLNLADFRVRVGNWS
jgi:hypothetical protein